MPIKYDPHYTISPATAQALMRIEAAKEKVLHAPLTAHVLSSLRETARLYTTHYSTMIEGNWLEPDHIQKIVHHQEHFPGREREEREIKGYYAGLAQVEQWTALGKPLTEETIKLIHALVIGNGKTKVTPTPYRDGQNAIRDSRTKRIVYLPPEAHDVPILVAQMIEWINREQTGLPCPLIAALSHYQCATIHPYYDGNGRTARLLTTLLLHKGGYDLKGIYSLEEYYARDLDSYYKALSVGPSHNYYEGRAQADITQWVNYFIEGMASSCEQVVKRMNEAHLKGSSDQSSLLRKLDPRQRKALDLFQGSEIITSRDIGLLFGFKPRTSSALCTTWVKNGFLVSIDPSNKGRKYILSQEYKKLITS